MYTGQAVQHKRLLPAAVKRIAAYHTASFTRLPLIVRYFTRKSTPAWMQQQALTNSSCASLGRPAARLQVSTE